MNKDTTADRATRGNTDPEGARQARSQAQYIEGDGTQMQLYVRSMGKLLAVTAAFANDYLCNAYLANHKDEGVIAQGPNLVLVANLYDHGTRAELPKTTDKTKLYL